MGPHASRDDESAWKERGTVACLALALLCGVPPTVRSQSAMEYQSGTTIEIQAGADICADAIVIKGSSVGGGTRCGGLLAVHEPPRDGMPVEFSLSQNFPNPFNPSTTIRYGLPDRSIVTLTIFNTLGQRVAILQQGEQDAGYHEVHFNAEDLSTGMYFYRMEMRGVPPGSQRDPGSAAGTFGEVKKFLYVR